MYSVTLSCLLVLLLSQSDAFLKLGRKRQVVNTNKADIARELRYEMSTALENLQNGIANIKRILQDAYTLDHSEELAEQINSLDDNEMDTEYGYSKTEKLRNKKM